MTTRTQFGIVAAIIAAGAASLAIAQDAPTTAAPADETRPAQSADARSEEGRHGAKAASRGERGHAKRHGGRHCGRGAMLGGFGPAGGQALFAAVDGDDDGRVTQAEIDAYLQDRLAAADADGNGAVGIEEFAPVFFEQTRPRMVDAFQRLDADGSGDVTSAELNARFGGIVERMDRDDDGALTMQDGRRGGRD
ncbi:hypothetical protein [Profundibacterium mesophilum]|uniref:Calcium-binding EF-hand domain protein n=1 Tax=Profundibacterium mesophilum KAUST100406-0324 TaxID=1037889 RepID=A0A921NS12_9RHOB|nr:hypothetical protein [Profundibacterium mesophilum]KAF0676820.1 putative calcium-binding EF-hand domain protein [Profundibacterium mesophilum KAUST100406-0324]